MTILVAAIALPLKSASTARVACPSLSTPIDLNDGGAVEVRADRISPGKRHDRPGPITGPVAEVSRW